MLPQDNVTLKFLFQATGEVSTSDIDLAVVSKAIILGFNVKAPGSVKSYAGNKGIEIRLYRVIYDLIDAVRNAMEGLLEPVEVTSSTSIGFYFLLPISLENALQESFVSKESITPFMLLLHIAYMCLMASVLVNLQILLKGPSR